MSLDVYVDGVRLTGTAYGKSAVRLVKVDRRTRRHVLRDVTVDVRLEGDQAAVHLQGDNHDLLATDTMRNAVYALAAVPELADVEDFGLALAGRFLAAPRVERATVRLVEHPWERIGAHDHAFTRAAGGERTATVVLAAGGDVAVRAGLAGLDVLKTTGSGFEGFLRDELTTLPETDDRILATTVAAEWDYAAGAGLEWTRTWEAVRDRLVTTFTDHYSPSVQHTLYRMGRAVLDAVPEVVRISLELPNRHHLLVDLESFGMRNDNTVFHVTSEPYGLMRGTLERA
jgi:urate oxidase